MMEGGELIIVKMAIFLKVLFRFNDIPSNDGNFSCK
jgi:hypothetical protein